MIFFIRKWLSPFKHKQTQLHKVEGLTDSVRKGLTQKRKGLKVNGCCRGSRLMVLFAKSHVNRVFGELIRWDGCDCCETMIIGPDSRYESVRHAKAHTFFNITAFRWKPGTVFEGRKHGSMFLLEVLVTAVHPTFFTAYHTCPRTRGKKDETEQ